MKLESITLKNFRCFDELDIQFDSELTVLVANNGGGKTASLDAIATVLSSYIEGFPIHLFPNSIIKKIVNSDCKRIVTDKKLFTTEPSKSATLISAGGYVKNKADNLYFQQQFPIVDKSRSYAIVRHFDKKTGKERSQPDSFTYLAEDYFQAISAEKRFTLPLVAYYGTNRLWQHTEEKWRNTKEMENAFQSNNFLSRVMVYNDSLNAGSDYISFMDWFQYISKAHADQRNALIEKYAEKALNMPTDYGDLIEAIRIPINQCLAETGWRNLTYSHIHQAIMLEHPEYGVMELNQLSDGIRNTAALVADIALRAVRLNKHLKEQACTQTPGIVLIDEIDLHLHPSWQQTIIPMLRKAFPKVQFIVTTHSPQVLSTVPKECIRVLGQNTQGKAVAAIPLAHSYGQPSNDVLQAIMHVDPQPPVAEKVDLERLTALVDQGFYENIEAQELLRNLKQTLGNQHPQINRIERSIHRQKIISNAKHKQE